MINPISVNGNLIYGIHEYLCDFHKDISNLPTGCAPGSLAYVIETDQIYIMTGQKEWKKLI